MTEYKANNLLLMWLQMFHLHCINHDFRNWSDFKNADQKDYNGNIFKWLKYEHNSPANPGKWGGHPVSMHEKFEDLLGWDGTSDYGTLGGIQFFELSTAEPTHYDERGEGDTGIYHYSTKKDEKNLYGSQLDNSLFYNDPEWYPWGPQWSNEKGFYYIAGQPGDPPIYSDEI